MVGPLNSNRPFIPQKITKVMGPKLHYTFFLHSPHQPRYPDPYLCGTPKASNFKEIKGLHTHTHLLKKKMDLHWMQCNSCWHDKTSSERWSNVLLLVYMLQNPASTHQRVKPSMSSTPGFSNSNDVQAWSAVYIT